MEKLPTSKKRIYLLVCAFLLLFVVQVQAAPPENLNYQGKLKDNVGSPITDPTTIQFSIYNHITNGLSTDLPSSAGPLLWTETYNQVAGDCAQVDPDTEGIFGQRLATCVVFPAYMDFTDEYYIGVKVGADGEATPRIPLSSNPYAHTAGGLFGDSEDINVQTENSGNVVFNSAGNIQMTSNDITPALIINQIGTGNLFEVQDNGVTSFVILDGGNVGIGNSAPRVALEIGNGAGAGDGAILATGEYGSGWQEPDMGAGTRMMWYPRKGAFRAGGVADDQWDDANIGDYSFAVGIDTVASGTASFAAGEESSALGTGSVAIGPGAQSTVNNAVAIGPSAQASGVEAVAIGSFGNAQGWRSLSFVNNTAVGDYSIAMGRSSYAAGNNSITMGHRITTNADYVMAIGLDDMAGLICDQANSMCIMGGEIGMGTIAPSTILHIDSNGANTTAILTLENTAGDFQIFRTDATPESFVTGSIGDLAIDGTTGDMYIKNSGAGTNTGWDVVSTGLVANNIYNNDGTFNAGRTIDANNFSLAINNLNWFGFYGANGEIEYDGAILKLAAHGGGAFEIGHQNSLLWYITPTVSDMNIRAANVDTKITDNRVATKGFEYAADYSAGFVDRSLVDKGYVDLHTGTALWDADGDTGIQVEEIADEDYIRFDTAGVERMTISHNGDFYVRNSLGNYIGLGGSSFEINNNDTIYFTMDMSNSEISYQSLLMILGDQEGEGAESIFTIDANNDVFTFENSNVGIGTTNPQNLLHLNSAAGSGMSKAQFTDGTTGTTATDGFTFGLGSTQKASFWNYENTDMNFGTNGISRLVIGNGGDFAVNTNQLFVQQSSGNVGIGTITPSFKLELVGTASTADRKIGINGTQVVYLPDQTDFEGSLFIGDGGGSISHPAGPTGYYNTGVGIGALFSNTTGYTNTATGHQSLHLNTTGSYNTANGRQSLYSNTTGRSNVASGNGSLYDVTEGLQNTAIGYNTGRGITTGDYNTILGASVIGLDTDLQNNVIIADGEGNIRIQSVGSGAITFNEVYTFPTVDGILGDVLQTNGTGALSWVSNGGSALWSKSGTDLSPATSGDDILLNDGETLSIANMTTGSVPFFGAGGLLSQDNANLFWDDTTNRLGIRTDHPMYALQVSGDHDEGRILIHDSDGNNDDEAGLLFAVSGDLSVSPAKGGLFFNRTATYGRGDLIFATDNNADSTEITKSDVRMSIKSTGEVIVGTASPTHIIGSGSLFVDQYLEIGKALYIGDSIIHTGDTDTFVDFGNDDRLEIRVGGVRMLSFIEGASDSIVINEYSADVDLRIEGDTEANLFFVDASTDNIGIGTATPRTLLELNGDGAILAIGAHGAGWIEPDLGAGTRMMFYPRESAFRVGYVNGTQWNSGSIGNYSVAMGHNTTASGEYSTALGSGTTASEDYTFAVGLNTSALGRYSSAFGSGSRASGRYSMAMGYSSDVAGNYAFTGGRYMQPTSGDGTFVWGYSGSAESFAPANNRFLIFPQGDAGRVGIGTTSPTASLHLAPSTATESQFRLEFSAGTNPTTPNSGDLWWNGTELYFYDGSTSNDLLAGGGGNVEDGAAAGQMLFWDGTSEYKHTETSELFWDDTGKRLGIGTATPRTAIELNGDGAILAIGTNGSGWTEPNLGAGERMMWYPRRSAFRAGGVSGTQWDSGSIGNYSVAMGYNTTASAYVTTAMGHLTEASADHATALGWSTTASDTAATAMGRETTASGQGSTALGWSTVASGNASTAMGYQTTASGQATTVIGRSITAGTNSNIVAIGLDTTTRTCNQANSMCVMGGNVGIGALSPVSILELESTGNTILTIDSGTSSDAEINLSENGTVRWNIYNDGSNVDRLYITDDDNDNGVYLAQDATSWTANSDIRLKENINTIDNALDSVLGMRGVRYNFIGTDNTEIGVIAQEVEDYFPEIVDTDGEYWGVSYSRIAPILIEAIKEQQIVIESLGDLSENEDFMALYDKVDENSEEIDMLKDDNDAMKQALCGLGVEIFCE